MSRGLGLAPALDDGELDTAAALSGREIRVEQYNDEATRDTIRHYALGIGDDNPLWCDPGYAARTPFGDLLAPPTFLYSVFDGAIGAGLPGVQPIYAGTEWTFRRRVRRGEQVVPHARFGDLRRLHGTNGGDMAIQQANTDYLVGDAVVASAVANTFRVPRRGATGGLQYEPREEYVYSDEELGRIRRDALGEFRRGSDPIDPATLSVGDAIPAVVKGPIDRITMTAYYAGCIGSPGYKACEVAWKYREWAEHSPELLPTNYDPSYFAETVLPSLGHQDSDVAREIGMPNAYDNGPQRCGWFGHAVTNWMGDHAFLSRLSVRLNRPDIFGDTVWISGEVAAVRESRQAALVDISLRAVNQLGDQVATGTAVVLVSGTRGEIITDDQAGALADADGDVGAVASASH